MPMLQAILPNPTVPMSQAKGVRSRQAQLGQFLTPQNVANFMAGMFDPFALPATSLMDAGAGGGALTIAFAGRWQKESDGLLRITAYEMDGHIQPVLSELLAELNDRPGVSSELVLGDFIERAATMIALDRGERYTHAILNPPYKKIGSQSADRSYLRAAGLETVNLYSGFVGLAVALLQQGGEIVAIIPRSFCNNPYYEPFRHFILNRAALRRIHLFDSRNSAFKADGVLQENVIIHMQRGAPQGEVIVSTSTDDFFNDLESRAYPFSEIVFPSDPARFIHIPSGVAQPLLQSDTFAFTLDDVGIKVSTGPVVDFRMKDELLAQAGPDAVPLLYPGHFAGENVAWPRSHTHKRDSQGD